MRPKVPRLCDYDVSPHHGFLPSEVPLEVLPDPYYQPWERIVKNLQALVLSRRFRDVVKDLPVLSTDLLATEGEWRRAYVVLSFITHAYIWGGNAPEEVVPPPVSIPFVAVCNHLELPLVATYAGVALWNWKPIFSDEPIDNLDNLATLSTFTGSLDESWFYLVTVAIEARGAPMIPTMLNAIAAARHDKRDIVVEALRSFAERLDELGSLLQRMYENCDPHIFYHRIRPFLAGSKNMADAGLPNGVLFDDGSGTQPYVQFSGGSAAESSLIQFFDIILGIEHRPTGTKPPRSSSMSEGSAPPGPSHNFILDMRSYMPGPHRRFLEDIARVANIRNYVEARRGDGALCNAFDACLAMLRSFRDKHIQMVSRFIIVKSRESRSKSRSRSPQEIPNALPSVPKNIANASQHASRSGGKLHGTGGTALIPFLKQARDETGEPAIDAWARRLLNNGPGDTYNAGATMQKVGEHASGEVEIVGLAGTWSVDDSEGGICHW